MVYTYIGDLRLRSITGINGNTNSYQLNYDAFGRTVARTLNGGTTYFIYDGEKPILEYSSATTVKAANVYGRGIDEILERMDYSVTPNRTLFYQDDHEGSITHLILMVSNVATVVESYRYDAFGKPTIYNGPNQIPANALVSQTNGNPQSGVGNRFMFTGREYKTEFGIYEYRNRAYHPGIGRFMSEDPKGFDTGDYNLFRYCGDDPLDQTDAMGLTSDDLVDKRELNNNIDPQTSQTVTQASNAPHDRVSNFNRLMNQTAGDLNKIAQKILRVRS